MPHARCGQLGILGRNPVDATTPPKKTQKEMQFYDEIQAQGLMIAAKATDDRRLALYQLAITTGMRQGELLGLKWDDLDWERKTLQVQRQLRRVVGGGYELAAPKTRAGGRSHWGKPPLRNCENTCCVSIGRGRLPVIAGRIGN